MWDTIIDSISHLIRNGISWASIAGVLFLFLKNRRLRKYINEHLPKAWREEDQMARLHQKIDAMMIHLGVKEECPAVILPPTRKPSLPSVGAGSISSWVASLAARFAKRFTHLNTRRKDYMKVILSKLASRKFWALVSAVVTSSMVLFGFGEDTITKVVALVGSIGAVMVYLLIEGSIDREAQKQQVYVVNPDDKPPEAPKFAEEPEVNLSNEEVVKRTSMVNQQLNQFMNYMDSDNPYKQEAIKRYMTIFNYLQEQGELSGEEP
ncbi:hypothetical protein [Paenibacillus chitinolyticus]|uniref:hypothetical protein n=1 Tax=Paenibacillus chitinolyticus TaxID=79263 RepID=UPI0036618719